LLALLAGQVAAGLGNAAASLCPPSQLRVTVQTQRVASAAWMGLTVRNRGAACTLGGSATFSIRQAGKRAAVQGNPLAVPLRAVLLRGHTRLAKAAWNNWCHARTGFKLVARFAGTTKTLRFRALPTCVDRRTPSRLVRID
jgi:hypothetical protein